MNFRKVTISIPTTMYEEGMTLVKKGLFSNFSDLVRSGIREEFKELQQVSQDFDERLIYTDEKLLQRVAQSKKEAKAGKGKILTSDKDMDKYFEAL